MTRIRGERRRDSDPENVASIVWQKQVDSPSDKRNIREVGNKRSVVAEKLLNRYWKNAVALLFLYLYKKICLSFIVTEASLSPLKCSDV